MAETRLLYACDHCGEEFGEGEENNGRCPHCYVGHGEPIGECEDDEPSDPVVQNGEKQ